MADHNTMGRGVGDPTPSERHAAIQAAALSLVLDEHPARCTVTEISLALNLGRVDFRGDDEVRNAIRDLAAAGLVHDEDGFISPTRPARCFARLLDSSQTHK